MTYHCWRRDRISRDGDRWRIFLRTEKSGQPVFLPVPPDLKAALDRVPAPLRNMESRYFFWNGIGTEKTHKAHVDRCLRAVFKASGVNGAHAHRFRHTLATELLGRGASFEEVADILGNSPEIVRQALRQVVSCAANRIDELMSASMSRPITPFATRQTHSMMGTLWAHEKILPVTARKNRITGGGRGIRTPERVTPLTVFKTAGFNHSPIPPLPIYPN